LLLCLAGMAVVTIVSSFGLKKMYPLTNEVN
jgi:hypothetical protein